MRPIKPSLIPLAALAAILALSACGADESSSAGTMRGMGHGAASRSSSAQAEAAGDVMFAQMMVPHHQQAIEMADLALREGAASARVKALARQIKAAQDPEIRTMNRWLREWNAPTPGSMDHGGSGGMMSADDMASLGRASGAGFDRLWLTMMIQHHEGALTMSRSVLATTSDAGVRSLAQAIVDGQQREIATMQGLLG